jgi:hypothetical protein
MTTDCLLPSGVRIVVFPAGRTVWPMTRPDISRPWPSRFAPDGTEYVKLLWILSGCRKWANPKTDRQICSDGLRKLTNVGAMPGFFLTRPKALPAIGPSVIRPANCP